MFPAWHGGYQPGAAPCRCSLWLCQMPTTNKHTWAPRGRVPLPGLSSARCDPRDGSSCARAAASLKGKEPGLVRSYVIWEPLSLGHGQGAERGSSRQVLTVTRFSIMSCGSPSHSMALHHFLMALHHFPWLSITPHGSPSHPLRLNHATLPLLRVFITSCSSSLKHPTHEHTQPHQPMLQPLPVLQSGPRRACGAPRPPPYTLLMAPFWVVASPAPGLQPPMGATSSPNPPLCWASTLQRCP